MSHNSVIDQAGKAAQVLTTVLLVFTLVKVIVYGVLAPTHVLELPVSTIKLSKIAMSSVSELSYEKPNTLTNGRRTSHPNLDRFQVNARPKKHQ